MTDKQPEALMLADAIELGVATRAEQIEVAAEIRRLHEVNAELVEALKEAAFHLKNECDVGVDEWLAVQVRTKAAINKAEGI